ncbi:GIY-YIG nuclease family protein [Mycobacterium noviomagense]|nr:GIY-YIG nuclease family protein [Mycobacterium noviomagense]
MAETGIKESDWRGRYWVSWSDAIAEAGLQPNSMQSRRHEDEYILRRMALLARKLGRFPTEAHLRLERRSDDSFPSCGSIRARLGDKSAQLARLRIFTETEPDLADVNELLATNVADDEPEPSQSSISTHPNGVVYLIKSGRFHKIGRSNHVGRRSYEIGLQLPEKYVLVHSFETDDPAGIERYWHDRFKDRRRNGEWFLLSKADVAAFKRRRRFM